LSGTDLIDAQQKLRKAKTAHLKWRTYAQALASGLNIDETKAPLDHTACEFGQWYHGSGQALRGVSPLFDDIAEPHRLLHEIYADLYQMAKARKPPQQIRDQLASLEGISGSLLELIDACIEDIRASQ